MIAGGIDQEFLGVRVGYLMGMRAGAGLSGAWVHRVMTVCGSLLLVATAIAQEPGPAAAGQAGQIPQEAPAAPAAEPTATPEKPASKPKKKAAEKEVAATPDVPLKASEVIDSTPAQDVEAVIAPEGVAPLPEEVLANQTEEFGGERPRSLSLSDALSEVWRTNPEVAKAQLALEAAGFDVSGARTAYYPYVQLQTEQNRNMNAGEIRVVQLLWSGGLVGAQVDVAKSQQKSALADLNRTRLQLGLNTSEAYLNVVTTAEQARQWRNYIDELRQLLRIIQRRATEGVAPQADVQTAQTRLSQAEAGYQANLSQLESNRAQLAALLNFMPGDLRWPDEGSKLNEDEIREAGKDISVHPEIQYAKAGVMYQEALADAAKASIWPQVNGEYRRGYRGRDVEPYDSDQFLLTLNYQTDSGLKAYRQYQSDRQRAESAKAALEASRRDVMARIRVARTNRQVSEAQFAVQVQAAAASRSLVESFLRQFDVGRKTWLEVLNAQREANDTILSAIAVRRQLWLANSQLALQGLYWRRLSARAPTIDVIEDKK